MAARLRYWVYSVALGLPAAFVGLWVADLLFDSLSIASLWAAVGTALIITSVFTVVIGEMIFEFLLMRRSGLGVLILFAGLFAAMPALWLSTALISGFTLGGFWTYLGTALVLLCVEVALYPITDRVARRWEVRHPAQVQAASRAAAVDDLEWSK